jgi:isopropylmalate/homocitrate/citramalate synthase
MARETFRNRRFLMSTGWVKANSSPLNFAEEVRKETYLPEKVYFHDNTLRDGEQFAGAVFTKEEKVAIAKGLNDYGVHRIELMPAVSQDDMEVTAKLNSMGLSSEIIGFCRAVKGDIQKAADAGCKAVLIEIISHPRELKAMGWSFESATEKMIEATRFAKEKGLRVTTMFPLILQAPPEFAARFIQKILAEAATDGLCIPDTWGTCMPHGIYHFIRKLKTWTDKPIEIHAHNHFGMGAAVAVAAVMAGAQVVHGCIIGLGEGGGNAPLEEIAVNLQLTLGIETGIRLEKTYELCTMVSKIAKLPLQDNWPLAGGKVFDGHSGVFVDLVVKLAEAGLAFLPEEDVATVLGRERHIVLGKMSGRNSVRMKMKQLGLPIRDEQQVAGLLDAVKDRAIEIHDAVTDDEFIKMVGGDTSGR